MSYSDSSWNEKSAPLALSTNDQRDGWWIDYFLFSRGLYGNEMPAFVIGTVRWDNWLLVEGLDLKLPVVDASQAVLAVHQNHDYNYHPQGKKGVWEGEESKRNLAVGGRMAITCEIFPRDAQTDGWRANSGTWMRRKWLGMKRVRLKLPMSKIWYSLLDVYPSPHATQLV